ncbi:MAG TPA: threonine/serine exporter family protein [Xanthomonadaceae bacterium]|nr:threonine/serine exporter family protein [Xanthomonadaceae bacterium]
MSPELAERIRFVVELAGRLHTYGTSAQRLEGAIAAVASRLGLQCQIWSNPTGFIVSFADPEAMAGTGEITRVVRLEPGEVDLYKTAATDAIAERVLAGELEVSDGWHELRALDRPQPGLWRVLNAASFGLAAACVAGLLRTRWADIVAAAAIGTLIGILFALGAKRPRLAEALDAVAALLAAFLATAIAAFIEPLALKSVVVAALIVLLPGLTLTVAVGELSSQHWVAGTARFAGAMTVLLKLAFGTVAATQLAHWLGWVPMEPVPAAPPDWLEWAALAVGSLAFAVLFRAQLRDYPLVMASAWLGYLTSRFASLALGNEAGVFLAGLVVSAAANMYARAANRPGALVRVPGIILLVPGSIGFRSLSFVFERDVFLGLDAGFTLVSILVALVAGSLFGNVLVPPRRSL